MTGQSADALEQEIAPAPKAAPPAPGTVSQKIEFGTPAFIRTNCALFAAGFATFALLYSVQPLMPLFSTSFHVSAAAASLALSLTTGLLAVSPPPRGAYIWFAAGSAALVFLVNPFVGVQGLTPVWTVP